MLESGYRNRCKCYGTAPLPLLLGGIATEQNRNIFLVFNEVRLFGGFCYCCGCFALFVGGGCFVLSDCLGFVLVWGLFWFEVFLFCFWLVGWFVFTLESGIITTGNKLCRAARGSLVARPEQPRRAAGMLAGE